MKVGLVYNPTAGGGRREALGLQVELELRRRGVRVAVGRTGAPGDASRLSRSFAGQVDAVVAVGGDGTINEVINGLRGGELPLGIVAAGTANILALEMDIPRDVGEACDVITAGYERAIDLGVTSDRHFTLMAGIGLDALTIRELDPDHKRRFKKLAFVGTGLRAQFRYPPRSFRITVDGTQHEATFAVIGNCRYYGGRFGMTTKADPTDGLLDVLLFRGCGTLTTGAFWLGSALRLHTLHPQASYLRGREISLGEPPPGGPIWYQTDGELAGRIPVEIGVDPLALRILVPEESDRRKGYAADRTAPAEAGAAELVPAHENERAHGG